MNTVNEFKLTGTLVSAKVETTPNGKQIARLRIETDPPTWMKAATKETSEVVVFGRTINEVQKYKSGQVISVVGRLRPREYNGRVTHDVIGEEFKLVAGGASAPVDTLNDVDPPF